MPLFSWPTLSEKPPERLGLACFGTVTQHTVLPAVFQSLVILGGKSHPDLSCAKGKITEASAVSAGWRTVPSQPRSHPYGHDSHILCHGSLSPHAQAMLAFLTEDGLSVTDENTKNSKCTQRGAPEGPGHIPCRKT